MLMHNPLPLRVSFVGARLMFLICLALLVTPIAMAQTSFEVGSDRFLGGPSPVHNTVGVDDLFMSGNSVRSESPISGSAHFAGREIIVNGAVGGDLYAAGMDIEIMAPVSGDATLAGYNISVGNVGGDLRATATKLSLTGTVDGYTIVTGDRVTFNAQVKGDVSLSASNVTFSETAVIEGNLLVFEDEIGKTEIPTTVISEDRIERRPAAGSRAASEDLAIWDGDHPVMKFFKRLVFVAIVVGLVAALLPRPVTNTRDVTFKRPFSTFWLGFLSLSAAIGSAIVLLMTGIAFILVPVSLLIAALGALVGYFIGVYVLGSAAVSVIGRRGEDGISDRVLAAGAGALLATLISRIPVLGWVGTLTIILLGGGALVVWLFRPKFFTPIDA
ncbi:MAG: hypothetical protein ACX94B_08190 [Henriciella sp.]